MSLVSRITAVVSAIGADIKALYGRVQALEASSGTGSLPAADIPAPTEIMVKQNGQWVVATWPQFMSWASVADTTATVQGTAVTVNGEQVTVTPQ